MLNGHFYLYSLDRSISNRTGVWLLLLFSCFEELCKLNTNSVDAHQTPRSAASDLELHCLPMSLLWGGWFGVAKVSYSFCHRGAKLILAYSCARPAVLAAGKGRRGILLFPLFLKFLSFASFFPITFFPLFLKFLSFSSFFPITFFHLLYYLFYLFSPFL